MISFETYFHLVRPSCRVEVNMSKWLQKGKESNLKVFFVKKHLWYGEAAFPEVSTVGVNDVHKLSVAPGLIRGCLYL